MQVIIHVVHRLTRRYLLYNRHPSNLHQPIQTTQIATYCRPTSGHMWNDDLAHM